MPKKTLPNPQPVHQVMVSSTFTDLVEHRRALIETLPKHRLHANVMENDAAKLVDVIDSSLQMVRGSAAYIGVISQKYGQIPKDSQRNPDELSITELEFNEALSLNRPILLFIMGEDHSGNKNDFEKDPAKETKLNAFRERAKKMSPESDVHRVYAVFNSLQEFKDQIASSLPELNRHLESEWIIIEVIPTPPAFYAKPDYIGSHQFVGRDPQLQELNDWARPADPANVLLFEAIGGNGKSMLTWEWTTKHAMQTRPDWAGRFWYSFYEKGAVMEDFCQRALAYMTGQRLEELRKRKTAELREPLLAQLHAAPWLLILDGLERVLVAYHRIDAAEVRDEEVNIPTDKIVNRDPCDAIRDEDNDLLRAVAAAVPSKILVSSRLTPRVLLNPVGQAIAGVRRVSLPGLRPSDAEKLLTSCDIRGDSTKIQEYLTENCDNHPLVIGVLAGLIHDYFPDRGNFDAWVTDSAGGGQLNFADLDLVQRRNHILRAAFDSLPKESNELLSLLALLSEPVDYGTLCALNHGLAESSPVSEAEHRRKLGNTMTALERRGLLQYEARTKRYDLHPVVRAVAAGAMKVEEKEHYGTRVVDYFSSVPHNPYEKVETLDDLRPGLHVVRTLLKLKKFPQAADFFRGSFSNALLFNLEAFAETLSLLQPFFLEGWAELPKCVDDGAASYLANQAGFALRRYGMPEEALGPFCAALLIELRGKHWSTASVRVANIGYALGALDRLAHEDRVRVLNLDLATELGEPGILFLARLERFVQLGNLGKWDEAMLMWDLLDRMERSWLSRDSYRPGSAEYYNAQFWFWRGHWDEARLVEAENIARNAANRTVIRWSHSLRGLYYLEQSDWGRAQASLKEAVQMAREKSILDPRPETALAFSKFHLGLLDSPNSEADRLAKLRAPDHRLLARLYDGLEDRSKTVEHALAAYKWAWADGEPYVHRYELTKTTQLLRDLDIPVPIYAPFDPAKLEKPAWQSELEAAIQNLREGRASRGVRPDAGHSA